MGWQQTHVFPLTTSLSPKEMIKSKDTSCFYPSLISVGIFLNILLKPKSYLGLWVTENEEEAQSFKEQQWSDNLHATCLHISF